MGAAEKIAELRALLLRANSMLDELTIAPAKPIEYVDQHDVFERYKVTSRCYLENARACAFESEKIGKQVRARVEIFEAWLASRRRQPQPTPANDAADMAQQAIDLAAERIARRAGRR